VTNSELTLKKLKTLLDHLHDGVFAIEDGVMVYANQALAALINCPLDEILQQPFTRFIFEEDLEKVVSYYQARLQGADVPNEYEFRMLSKQGKAIDVRINVGVSVADDGLRTSIGTIKDLRETKRTMRDLARSQRDIASILDNMPDVFYRTDLQGMITLMSPSCEEVLGYAADEMIGRPLASFYCTPSEREKILNALKEGKGKARHVEACLTHKNGCRVWISTNAYMRHSCPCCRSVRGMRRPTTRQAHFTTPTGRRRLSPTPIPAGVKSYFASPLPTRASTQSSAACGSRRLSVANRQVGKVT
jgi:PAS domain S-box-containing protein